MSGKRLCPESFGIPKIHVVRKTTRELAFFSELRSQQADCKHKRQKIVEKYKVGSIFTCPRCKSDKNIQYRDKFCRSSDEGAKTTVDCKDCRLPFNVG